MAMAMKQFSLRLALLILVSLPCLDIESSVANRRYIRYNNAQLNELIFALNQLNRPIHG